MVDGMAYSLAYKEPIQKAGNRTVTAL